jgi:predicted anti-sigma-YlaC factor YlaD
MSMRSATPENCVRARQQVSLRLDSELSELETVLLETHLAVCANCREVAAELDGLTGTLRTALPEQPAVAFGLPPRRRSRVHGRAVSITATAAVMALSGFIGLHLSSARTPGELRAARELTTFKEQQLDRLATVAVGAAQETPAGVAAAEQMTVVSVSSRTTEPRRSSGRSYPDRPFGGSEGR